MFSSRARNRSRSSPPAGSLGRIGGSSSLPPSIESSRLAAAKRKSHLQGFGPQIDSTLQDPILRAPIRRPVAQPLPLSSRPTTYSVAAYVAEAKQAVARAVALPPGYSI